MKTLHLLLISLFLACGPAAAQNKSTALTDLTPDNAVLVYVDFNTGLDNLLTTVPGPQFMTNVRAFARLPSVFPTMPVALFGEENEFYGPFYPEIKALEPKGRRFPRTTPSGYTPEFAKWLKATGRKNVIIGGISIDNCTMHTTLDLLRNGYTVFVMPDVSPTNNPVAMDAAMTRLVAAGAIPQTWVSIATDLVGDWNSEAGKRLMPAMRDWIKPSTVGSPQDPTPDGKGF